MGWGSLTDLTFASDWEQEPWKHTRMLQGTGFPWKRVHVRTKYIHTYGFNSEMVQYNFPKASPVTKQPLLKGVLPTRNIV